MSRKKITYRCKRRIFLKWIDVLKFLDSYLHIRRCRISRLEYGRVVGYWWFSGCSCNSKNPGELSLYKRIK